jgi:hypothetical protein
LELRAVVIDLGRRGARERLAKCLLALRPQAFDCVRNPCEGQ